LIRKKWWWAGLWCACGLLTSLLHARSIPDPQQRSVTQQTAVSQEAAFSPATNWQLQCVGCHLPQGEGLPHTDTPRMKGFVGNFLKVEGGREFLVRVPGASQSALTDQQLAELFNWIMRLDGLAGESTPEAFIPYTAEEITAVRHIPFDDLPGTRAGLITQMRELGIVITDGMHHEE